MTNALSVAFINFKVKVATLNWSDDTLILDTALGQLSLDIDSMRQLIDLEWAANRAPKANASQLLQDLGL